MRKALALLLGEPRTAKESQRTGPSKYYDEDYLQASIRAGGHRAEVGGVWDEIGKMQLDFLRANGLTEEMAVLDIGCGCLRAGIHLVGFLNAGNYYGLDISPSLLEAGYSIELAAVGLQSKLPRTNLLCDDSFSFERFNRVFDVAIAQSLFTHLPLNHIRVCLTKLVNHLKECGMLFVTFFECPTSDTITTPIKHQPGGIITYPDRDPYHYYLRDLEHCIESLPMEIRYIGDWDHPRGQRMVAFRRTEL